VAVSSQAAKKFSSAEPIRLKLGERARIIVINYTMMDHPIHLHGLWNELDNGHGEFRSYKHTINVKGGERLSYLVSADAPGHWCPSIRYGQNDLVQPCVDLIRRRSSTPL
jgi:FtsP/CotA-like multicopper oxidase with cupredoxin domain